jgi:hypothetical protein
VALILWIIAVIVAIYGILMLIRGRLAVGIGSLIAAALIGPGGVSVFT